MTKCDSTQHHNSHRAQKSCLGMHFFTLQALKNFKQCSEANFLKHFLGLLIKYVLNVFLAFIVPIPSNILKYQYLEIIFSRIEGVKS